MPQVSFYTLSEKRALETFVCQLTAKISDQGEHRLLILAKDQQQQEKIDERLWTFNDVSFIPHSTESSAQEAVVIHLDINNTSCDVLMNLSSELPGKTGSFSKILEIVSSKPEDKQNARQRYRYYQEQGYELEHHEIA